MTDPGADMLAMGGSACAAAEAVRTASPEVRTRALEVAARALRKQTDAILAANARDGGPARPGPEFAPLPTRSCCMGSVGAVKCPAARQA